MTLNWNSLIRAAGSMATYLAIMGVYLAGVGPLVFALCAAVILAIGLALHSIDLPKLQLEKQLQPMKSVMPTLAESMAELHTLQNDINDLQALFSAENTARARHTSQDESAS